MQLVNQDEFEALARVESTFGLLGRHGDTYTSHLVPTPGSAIALDDDEWQPLPLSQHVWGGLAAVYDHFDIVRLTLESKRLFPTGVYSLLRGALLGACQALWLVEADDPLERRERARRFTEEWYLHRIQYQQELTPDLSVDDAARSALQLKRFDDDLAEVRRRRTSKTDFQATRIIRDVASAAFPSAPKLQRDLTSSWRRMGGDAHVLGWAMMTQNTEWGPKGEDGLTGAVVTVSPLTMASSYLGSWIVYCKARKRLYELSGLVDPAIDGEAGNFGES